MADSESYEVTRDQEETPSGDDTAHREHPDHIGRYLIQKALGKGGFGIVYLAHDERLDRPVAIKVPHARLIMRRGDAEAYLAEARTVANLDHPGIVPVYDVGSTEGFPCYIVSKYIDGITLATKLRHCRLSYSESAELVTAVAEALHYAHKQGLVHRDVKPGNILIGTDGKPYVVDFGLALREENIGTGPKYAGTPAYMSPEQARGEGHRVDGRSDIFNLGVVFYELLVGRQPFRGGSQAEVLEQVTSYEPRPVRQYDEKLPKELERICHKAMAKRASERYSTAHEMAEDLRQFLSEPSMNPGGRLPGVAGSGASDVAVPQPASNARSSTVARSSSTDLASSADSLPIKIVPKGLRSFDAHDADFFLNLVPGPRDRAGLPDSVRFWKIRIEELDPDSTFAIGLIYGPSGCGKSSLVKAGLLPRLSDDVLPIYIEATFDETEIRLLHAVRKRCPALEDHLTLKETLSALRRGQGSTVGKKVLIILDQFEQWLHAHKDQEATELVQALRQCDGGRVQCIVMVRDDFWLAISRFMRALETRLVEGDNSALLDLFDIDHAKKVLAAFGRAFGKLPESVGETTKEQKDFLTQSIAGLADEGKVICVRLALFAEMMKGKSWTPATLKNVGGTKGVGVTFLEETFSAATAPPKHRYHQKAARAVLKDLLPDSDTGIKGRMRSHAQLLEASGYGNRPADFDDLIRILDSEIRLITPTDPEATDEGEGQKDGDESNRATSDSSFLSHPSSFRCYQLAHDYLVHSLRDWLTRKQRETRRGRAELLLCDRAEAWQARPQNRLLPTWWENLNIRLLTDQTKWSLSQREMMGKAGRMHGIRTGLMFLLILGMGLIGLGLRRSVVEQRNEVRTRGLVNSLLNANIAQLPTIVSQLSELRPWADPMLKSAIANAEDGSAEKLHLSLALLPVDESQFHYLGGQLLICTLDQFPVVREALLPHRKHFADKLWLLAQEERQHAHQRFQAAAALALYAPNDQRWQGIASFVSQYLTDSVSSVYVDDWLKLLQPARNLLADPLAVILGDRHRSSKQREIAALALADYWHDQPDKLCDAILVADELAEFSVLKDALRPHAAVVKERLLAETRAAMPDQPSAELRDTHWRRQSLAAVTLVHLGFGETVWSRLQFTPDPSLRSFMIHHLGNLGTDHNMLADRLQQENQVSIRRALIQSLGGLEETIIPPADRNRIIEQLQKLYVADPDPGIHGSASWALREWGQRPPELPMSEPAGMDRQQLPGWYVDRQMRTMVVIPIPPESGDRAVTYNLAISSQEVAVAEFRRFREQHPVIGEIAPTDDCPVHHVNWYLAAEYCNWLSEQNGIPEDQWVYRPSANGRYVSGMSIKPNHTELLGYRLPTAAEWEYACRAGTRGLFSFGEPLSLLDGYAYYVLNSAGRSHSVGSLLPNEFGLFDMHGNLWEWTEDPVSGPLSPVTTDSRRVMRGGVFLGLPQSVHSGNDTAARPDNRVASVGFRPARMIDFTP